MKNALRAFALGLALGIAAPVVAQAADAPARQAAPTASAACPALLSRTFPRLQDESPQDLCQYSGRVVLIVNTASRCGFTGQYDGLEKLFEKYRTRGLVVLGFPSNDFGQQEPGTSKQIADFCENTFGVRFPMFTKTRVSGPDADPLYVELARQSGSAPKWNFHKYLVGRDGRVMGAYGSTVGPSDRKLVQDIERSLKEAGS